VTAGASSSSALEGVECHLRRRRALDARGYGRRTARLRRATLQRVRLHKNAEAFEQLCRVPDRKFSTLTADLLLHVHANAASALLQPSLN